MAEVVPDCCRFRFGENLHAFCQDSGATRSVSPGSKRVRGSQDKNLQKQIFVLETKCQAQELARGELEMQLRSMQMDLDAAVSKLATTEKESREKHEASEVLRQENAKLEEVRRLVCSASAADAQANFNGAAAIICCFEPCDSW